MALHVDSTKQALVDLANAMNKKSFSLSTITVGAPSPDDSVPGMNSVAKFSAIKGKGYRGDVDVHYIRLTTEEAFGIDKYKYHLESLDSIDPEAILKEVLTKLSADWSLPLTGKGEIGEHTYEKVGDIDDIVIGTILVDLSPNYVLHEYLEISLINPKIPLPDVIVITRLDGFREEDVELEDNG